MSKQLSHPRIGFFNTLEQSIHRLFSPHSADTIQNANFVAPLQSDAKAEAILNYHAELPAEEPKLRMKPENTFKLDESNFKLKPESKPKPEYSELKPEIKLLHTGFNVAVTFSNNFKLPAKIYSRRGFEKDFKFLALDTFSPYLDNRPKLDSNLEEEREYQVIFFDENQEVGKMSEIVKIKI
jgi:hypothetical protein